MDSPGTSLEGALLVAEKIRSRVQNQAFPHSSLATGVTVSIGVAAIEAHTPEKPQDLLAFADRALYRAKAAGRNCVRAYSEEQEPIFTI